MQHLAGFGAGLIAATTYGLLLFSHQLSSAARRWLARGAFLVAFVCGGLAIDALRHGGSREFATRAFFVHHHYVVDQPVAPAWWLPAWFGLIFVVIGVWFARSRGEEGHPRLTWGRTVGLAAALLMVRYSVDRAASPEWLGNGVGIFWLIPPYAIYVAYCRLDRTDRADDASWPKVAAQVVAMRTLAFLGTVVTTLADLGSHYSLVRVLRVTLPGRSDPIVFTPASAKQLLILGAVPQLVIWTSLTLACVMLTSCATRSWLRF